MSGVNDRGTKKWTALMMPEQIQMLNKYWEQEERKEKPVLDEQQIEEIEMKLQMAIHNDLTVKVKYFANHHFYYVKDKISSINTQKGYIFLKNNENAKFRDIIDVQIL
ncbi:YolD-like family protein [Virgibacillus sp. NKC19-16]|uniref:YolD-like family protein n=1 Tax=Virgibacillus salidurans TaxID=2831673 RepID=UPI001F194295|nr:YolD-like family protein [Virgibacillus sp. NKC19-16]UJL47072.1 YolD-like family protein [Virgibacillus sp. NKC19-16]